MKDLIGLLGSLKISIALLALIVVALATGTIVESMHGSPTALARVYHALWFRALLGLFAMNVLCSILDLWPWGARRAGYLMTHGAMLLILAGALMTERLGVEGRLPIWEGDRNATVVAPDGSTFTLPFALHLDAFEIDYYQGTMRPAMFRSRVVVHDPQGEPIPAVIEMNRELAHGGYRFFQSSYKQTEERDQTILMVSKDPGQPVVFAGYTLLMIGMVTVLVTRIAQRRAAARHVAAAGALRRVAAIAVAAGLAAAIAPPVGAAEIPEAGVVEQLAGLAVQHDGRIMPLDTLAREAVWNVTRRSSWQGQHPVATVLGWTFDPEGWAAEPIVRLPGEAFAAAAGIPASLSRASFSTLVENPRVIGLMQEARDAAAHDRPLTAAQRDAQKLEGRLIWMQRFLVHDIIRAVPAQEGGVARWAVPEHLHGPQDLIAVAQAADTGADRKLIAREITYNTVRPSRLAWWILLAATAAAIAAWARPRRLHDALALGGLIAGFVVMTWGIAVRWQVAGRIPASNMYESLLFLGWGVALFALVALVALRSHLLVLNATAMAALTMLLADVLPIDPFIHPMPPVLSGTPWLAIHVPIIMVSYSVLALGVLIAHMQIGVSMFAPRREALVQRMTDLLYWYMHIGAILLIAGILTGSIWAASSWGRYWGWDPKEVWSLIAFLAYIGILHGRLDKILGPFAVAAISIVAFWTILMTYIGVNFVLSSGLHSYGFGDSAVLQWMAILGGMEVAFLFTGWLMTRRAPHAIRRATA